MSDIRIEFIGSKDVPELVEFIKKHFFMVSKLLAKVPSFSRSMFSLTKSAKSIIFGTSEVIITFQGESIGAHLNISSDCKELEEYCIKSVPENCSFKAVNSKGKMVGALTNAIIERPVSILTAFH